MRPCEDGQRGEHTASLRSLLVHNQLAAEWARSVALEPARDALSMEDVKPAAWQVHQALSLGKRVGAHSALRLGFLLAAPLNDRQSFNAQRLHA